MELKKYNVIYADPPWSYDQKQVGRGNKSGAIDKYDLMSNVDIKDLPVKDLTDTDSLLFMWATVPLLNIAFEVIPAWGFTYKTLIIWEKTGLLGMGNWVRVQEEVLLIGIKGKPKPFGHQEKNIYRHQICQHSAKPHFFREKVVELASKSFDQTLNPLRKLELFARTREGMFGDYEYEGWDVYGNQVNNSIKLSA